MLKYDCIDLTNVYNNKLILNKFDDIDINDNSDYFLYDSFYRFIDMNNIKVPFVFPKKNDSYNLVYDNISCEGQIINLNQKSYKSIYFIGLCEWGDMRGEVTLNFINGISINSDIFFYDWYRIKEEFFMHDIKDLNCSILKVLKTTKGKKSLYIYNYHFCDMDNIFESIQLPFIPNMHIFSITLAY